MEIRNMKVSELMKVPQAMGVMKACGIMGFDMCVVLNENDNVEEAVRVMTVSGLDHVLIYGEDGITGTLSNNDLIKAFK